MNKIINPKLDYIQHIIFRFLYHLVSMIRYFNKPVNHELFTGFSYHFQFNELQHELDNIVIALKVFEGIMRIK